jgi:adiponectin receptor
VARYTNDGYLLLVALCYVVGAVLYLTRFPEKYFPGKFDFVFSSHQLWHLLVFAAAVIHYHGLVRLYTWRVELEEGVCVL